MRSMIASVVLLRSLGLVLWLPVKNIQIVRLDEAELDSSLYCGILKNHTISSLRVHGILSDKFVFILFSHSRIISCYNFVFKKNHDYLFTCISLVAGASKATMAAMTSPCHSEPSAAMARSALATTYQLMSTADSSARSVDPRSHIVHFTVMCHLHEYCTFGCC